MKAYKIRRRQLFPLLPAYYWYNKRWGHSSKRWHKYGNLWYRLSDIRSAFNNLHHYGVDPNTAEIIEVEVSFVRVIDAISS